jgi:hypothetical protein
MNTDKFKEVLEVIACDRTAKRELQLFIFMRLVHYWFTVLLKRA